MSSSSKNKKTAKAVIQDVAANNKNLSGSQHKNGFNIALVILVIILPLLISNAANDPVIPLRFICLSIFCTLLSVYLILQLKKEIHIAIPKLFIGIILISIGYSLWSIYVTNRSVNPSAGYFDIIRYLLFFIFTIICFILFKNKPATILIVCKAIAIMGIIHSFIGISQYYGKSFLQFSNEGITNGLMANRTLFASAQVLLLPFVLYAFKKSNTLWRGIYISSFYLIIYSLILSQTRSAWVAVIIFMSLTFFLVLIVMKNDRKQWLKEYAVAIAGIIVLSFIILKTDKNALDKSIEGKLANTNFDYANDTTPQSNSGAVRIGIWKKTNQLISDYPITGVGLGNWKIKVRDYGSNGTTWLNGKTVPDRVHNVYLQIIAETGYVGAIFYFSVWLLLCYCAISTILKKDTIADKWLNIIMLGGLISFFVDCVFGFPTERMEHNMYFALMSAIILVQNNSTQHFVIKNIAKWKSAVFIIVMILVSCFGVFIGFKKLNFEAQLPLANANQKAKNNDDAIEAVEKGKSKWVTLNEEGKPLELYSSLAYLNKKEYDNALKEARIALHYNPNGVMIFNNLGAIFANMGKHDSAIFYYQKALHISPKFEEPLKNMAGAYYNLKQYDSCISTIQKLNYQNDNYLTKLLSDAKQLKELNIKKN